MILTPLLLLSACASTGDQWERSLASEAQHANSTPSQIAACMMESTPAVYRPAQHAQGDSIVVDWQQERIGTIVSFTITPHLGGGTEIRTAVAGERYAIIRPVTRCFIP
jgi:hypothetical protein